jgi:hypothetical protein
MLTDTTYSQNPKYQFIHKQVYISTKTKKLGLTTEHFKEPTLKKAKHIFIMPIQKSLQHKIPVLPVSIEWICHFYLIFPYCF